MAYEQDMRIDSEAFLEIRESFDAVLQNLLQKMDESGSDEGTLDLKLTIQIDRPEITVGARIGETVPMPSMKYKCMYTVPVKDGVDGKKDTGMELVWDKTDQRYVLRPVNLDGQMSLSDYENGFNNYPDEDEDEEDYSDVDAQTGEIAGPGAENAKQQDFLDAVMHGEQKETETAPESGSDEAGKEDITRDAMNVPTGGTEATGDAYEYDEPVSDEDYRAYEESIPEPDIDLPFA